MAFHNLRNRLEWQLLRHGRLGLNISSVDQFRLEIKEDAG